MIAGSVDKLLFADAVFIKQNLQKAKKGGTWDKLYSYSKSILEQ